MGRRAMSEEPLAVSRIAPAPAAQADYDAICAALMHTGRGRWFLDEYARRNRSADTRLLLTAIERIEAVVCAERSKQAQQGLRTDLLEMAQAITRTRAEVAEIRAEGASPVESGGPDDAASTPPRSARPRDVFAAAERIRDVTWAMRGHGFDPSTCDQLEELAAAILSASALRDPADHRASKLGEVLQYLERRIDALLESCTDGDAAAPASQPDQEAIEPAARRAAKPTNGFAVAFVAGPAIALEAADFDADPASPPLRRTDPGDPLPAACVEIEEAEDFAVEFVEVEAVEIEDGDPSRDAPEPAVSAQDHELAAQTADQAPAPPAPVPAAPFAQEDGTTAFATPTEPRIAFASPDLAAAWSIEGGVMEVGPHPQLAPSPTVRLIDSSQLLPRSPELRATAAAGRSFLPEIDMRASTPSLDAAWARRAPPAVAAPAPAATAPHTSAQPPYPAPAAHAPAALADPLAALKAMSDHELIALFS